MPERLWNPLLVIVVAILIGVLFQDRRKIQSLEEERSARFDQQEKLAIEASQLKQQVTRMKEQQHETDRVSRRSSAKLAALEEDLEKLEDERLAWDDEKDRLLIREKNLKQQHDDCRSQLKAADSATTEEKSRRLRTESNLEELRKELLRCNLKTTQEVLLSKAQSGSLKTEEVTKIGNSSYKAYPVFVKQFKTEAALEENELISRIAILNEDVFAITVGTNIIERFDSATLSTQETLLLKGSENLKDIQPCNQSESLFLLENESTDKVFISSVDPYNKEILHSWAVNSCVERFSVTEDCHVITVCPDNNRIIEYSSTGHLIREIIIMPETGIVRPRFALKITNGNFLVSYYGQLRGDAAGLAILNSNGDVLKFYSDPSQERHMMSGMAIDRLGNILVAEFVNGRVLLLSSDLEYQRELVSREHGIGVIMTILLDEVNGRLFVVDCDYNFRSEYLENGRVLVFDIQ